MCPCHGPMASVYPHRLIIGYSGKRFQSAKKGILYFFTECGDSSYSGHNDRAQITKTICNVVRCFAFLHRFAHQRIFWPPAGQTLSSCSSSLYWHLLNISDLQTKKLVLFKAFDISMVLLTTLLSAIICDADWTLRQNLLVNSRQV